MCKVINICYCNITVTVNVPEGLPCMLHRERVRYTIDCRCQGGM